MNADRTMDHLVADNAYAADILHGLRNAGLAAAATTTGGNCTALEYVNGADTYLITDGDACIPDGTYGVLIYQYVNDEPYRSILEADAGIPVDAVVAALVGIVGHP